jgi:hypothetical protein
MLKVFNNLSRFMYFFVLGSFRGARKGDRSRREELIKRTYIYMMLLKPISHCDDAFGFSQIPT